MTEPLRIVIADDHPMVREGLRAVLDQHPDLEVVAAVGDGAAAVAAAEELTPDVVLMDIQMPVLDGIEATRQIRDRHPEVAVLVLTMFEDDESVLSALRAGASGYLLKGAEEAEITNATLAVAAGSATFGPAVASRVLALLAHPPAPEPPFPELTGRERQILDRIARGDSNHAIADGLRLSPKTIANIVSNIFTKLSVHDRAQAVIHARDAGLGQPPTLGPPPR
jgi:DNA-binding NarL/FixJ family response regulator